VRCDKCGSAIIKVLIGDKIPWLACARCDKAELDAIALTK